MMKVDMESVCGENPCISDVFMMVRAEQATSQKGCNMPKGLQLVQEADGDVAMADDWEMIRVEDWAMAMVMEAAEGLNPTYVEAKR